MARTNPLGSGGNVVLYLTKGNDHQRHRAIVTARPRTGAGFPLAAHRLAIEVPLPSKFGVHAAPQYFPLRAIGVTSHLRGASERRCS
jgi:hypothetical protein